MAFKFVLFAAVIATVRAGLIPAGPAYAQAPLAYAAPAYAKVAAPVLAKAVAPVDEYDPNPQYSYAYDIQDGLTGDSKSQQESRNGDVVQGSYSVVDPDGVKRTVEYTADPVNGFNAVVHRQPLGAPVVAKAVAPVAYAAPVAKAFAPAYPAYAAGPALAKVSVAAPAYAYSH